MDDSARLLFISLRYIKFFGFNVRFTRGKSEIRGENQVKGMKKVRKMFFFARQYVNEIDRREATSGPFSVLFHLNLRIFPSP